MVHVSICYFGQISMIEMVGKFKSEDYIKLLDTQVFPCVPHSCQNTSLVWQQDNASIHTGQSVKDFFWLKI